MKINIYMKSGNKITVVGVKKCDYAYYGSSDFFDEACDPLSLVCHVYSR